MENLQNSNYTAHTQEKISKKKKGPYQPEIIVKNRGVSGGGVDLG